ncbi:MAG: SDR family NAD(P)-dependent oxidoreductase [bacterium]
MSLQDKVVVITGGAKGLGLAMATTFLSKGAHVQVCDKDGSEVYMADVTDESQVKSFIESVVKKYGRVDIWINNAGIWMPPEYIENVDMEKAKKLFDINVFGTINGVRVASKQMKSQGHGIIMNIISTTAFDGMNGSSGSMYVASKYALRGLTNTLRGELKLSHIDVIGVYPGGIKTDIFNEAPPKNLDQFMSVDEVALKIVVNLEKAEPETELIIKRPGQKDFIR